MAITQSVVAALSERFAGRRIDRVVLVVGQLSGVVVDSVRFCFDLCTSGTELDGAQLEVLTTAGHGRCRACDEPLDIPDLLTICPCGSADLEVLAGQELAVRNVEVRI